ncbi:MAG: hypothetical protein ACTTJW_01135 [Sphaerochaeta sp.]
MGKKRGFLHNKRRIVAYNVKGGGRKNLVFDSIQECVSYFNEMGHQLKSTQVIRLLEGAGVWGYKDVSIVNGVAVEKEVQFIFDELYDMEEDNR